MDGFVIQQINLREWSLRFNLSVDFRSPLIGTARDEWTNLFSEIFWMWFMELI